MPLCLSLSKPNHVWLREKEEELRIEKKGAQWCDAASTHVAQLLGVPLRYWKLQALNRFLLMCLWGLGLTLAPYDPWCLLFKSFPFFIEASDAEMELKISLSPCMCSVIAWSQWVNWCMWKFHQKTDFSCQAKGRPFEAPPLTDREESQRI